MKSTSTRVYVSLLACSALVASVFGVVSSAPSSALSPGVSFTADALPTWQTNGVVWALGQTQGKVIAGGTFTKLRPPEGGKGTTMTTSSLAILDAETGEPDDCQLAVTHDVPGLNPIVFAVAAAADGTVYLGGDFSKVGGVNVSRLAAINVVSCTVTPFRAGQIDSFVRALALHDQTLYVAGDFDNVSSQARGRFAAINTATGALRPWTANGDEASGRAIGVSPDGTQVALGGDFDTINGVASHALAVVDGVTGAVERTYTGGFIPSRSTTKHIFSGPDRFYVSAEGTGKKAYDGRLAIDWDSLDQVWRDGCQGATQATLEYAGTLYSASHAHDCTPLAYQKGKRNFFNAQKASNAAFLGWDPRANDGIGEGIGPRALTIATGSTSGKPFLWSGGEFTQINGAAQQGLTRFGTDDVGAPPRPAVYAEATSEGTIQVRWRTVVDPDDSRLTYSVFRKGKKSPVWVGTADSLWWKSPQITFVDRKVKAGKKYTYRVRVSDGSHSSQKSPAAKARATRTSTTYASVVRSHNPKLYWSSRKTDGNSPWVQEVGATSTGTRRLDGRVAGGAVPDPASPVRGDSSGSIKYDGKNDYLWNDEYVAAPRVYSVEAWFKTRTSKGGTIIGYGNGRPKTNSGKRVPSPEGSFDRVVYLTNKGKVQFGVDPGSPVAIKSKSKYNDGRWHHVVATQNGSGMKLYVDGKKVAKRSTSSAGSYLGVWHVGGDNLAGFPNEPRTSRFTGLIDEVAVYSKALKRKQVKAHTRAASKYRG